MDMKTAYFSKHCNDKISWPISLTSVFARAFQCWKQYINKVLLAEGCVASSPGACKGSRLLVLPIAAAAEALE